MTEIELIRHGETDWNQLGRWQGQADVPMNIHGHLNVQRLAERLSKKTYAAIWSSDLTRARETAEILGSIIHLPVRTDARLREMNLGRWEGMLAEDIVSQYPAEWHKRELDPLHFTTPDGESPLSVLDRVQTTLDEISAKFPAARVAVVTHKAVIALLLAHTGYLSSQEIDELGRDHNLTHVIQWPPTRKVLT